MLTNFSLLDLSILEITIVIGLSIALCSYVNFLFTYFETMLFVPILNLL